MCISNVDVAVLFTTAILYSVGLTVKEKPPDPTKAARTTDNKKKVRAALICNPGQSARN